MGNYVAELTNNQLIVCVDQEHPLVSCVFRNSFFHPHEAVPIAGERREPSYPVSGKMHLEHWGWDEEEWKIIDLQWKHEQLNWSMTRERRCHATLQSSLKGGRSHHESRRQHFQKSELYFWMCWSQGAQRQSAVSLYFDANGGSLVFEMCLESSHSCHCLSRALGSVLFTHSPSCEVLSWRLMEKTRLCSCHFCHKTLCYHLELPIFKKGHKKDNSQHELLPPFNSDEKSTSDDIEITLYQLWPSFCRGGPLVMLRSLKNGNPQSRICHIPVLNYWTVKVLPKLQAGKTILSAAQINYFQSALV